MSQIDFVSPCCHKELIRQDNYLICSKCSRRFEKKEGINIFIWGEKFDDFKKKEAECWDGRYEGAEATYHANRSQQIHFDFKKYLTNLPKEAKILELACGARVDSLELIKEGKEVVASDISLVGLKRAEKLASSYGGGDRLTLVLADAEHLPFSDSYFDACLVVSSFHHMENPRQALKEMRRVTKKEGLIILALEPASWPYYTFYPLLYPLKFLIRRKRENRLNSIADDRTRGFTPRSFKKMFEELDLEIIEITPAKFFLEYYDAFIRLLNSLLKKDIKIRPRVQRRIIRIDKFMAQIPLIKNLPWFWTAIVKVKK